MLQLKEITSRRTLCELKVKSICSQLVALGIKFESFPRNFEEDINNIPRVNTSHCSDWYKLKIEPSKIEVWHLNVLGNMDRLVCVITDDGVVAADPFGF